MFKIIIGFFIALFAAYLCFSYFTSTTITPPDRTPVFNSIMETAHNDKVSVNDEDKRVDTSSKSTTEKNLDNDNSIEDSHDFFNQFTSLTKSNFLSSEQFTSGYLNEDGEVSKAALEDTFKARDFEEFIAQVDSIEKSDNAAVREATLAQSLYKLDDVQIYSEHYACVGKICVVSFDFDGNEENINELSTFTNNYSFTNIVEDENGTKKFKAVYIETNDPSTLSLSY